MSMWRSEIRNTDTPIFRDLFRGLWSSETGEFSPLDLNPLFVYDSERILKFSASNPIVKVRRETEGDEVDIYGFNPDDPRQYQTSAGGAYVTTESLLFPSETFFVVTLYDQSGNAVNATQSIAANQPQLYWEGATFGSELATNGDFSGGTTGWSPINAVFTVTGGIAKIVPVATTGVAYIYQAKTLTTGKNYKITSDLVTNTEPRAFEIGTLAGGPYNLYDSFPNAAPGSYEFYFQENGNTTYFIINQADTDPITDYIEVDNFSAKEVLTWNYPIIKPDRINDNMNITITNSASDYSLFIRTKQVDTTETLDYILDIQTGVLRFAYPADSADTVGYYDSAWRTATLADTDWANITMVLEAATSGAIYNENTSIGSGLTYTQTAIGGTVKIFSDIAGANNYGGKIKCLILFPSVLTVENIANLVTYYS